MSRSRVLALACAALLALPACGLLRERSPERPPVIDLNTASLRRVEALPGITPSMARRIVDGRPYADPHDLVERDILTERELERIRDHVTVKPHDD
jgi:DNA uptake protein ComE-like DNA-binding protein